MEGDPQLFGVMPKNVTACTLVVHAPQGHDMGWASISLSCEEKRTPMIVAVYSLTKGEMGTVVGMMTPLAVKATYVNWQQMRRHMWHLFRTLGIGGKEVAIHGCGKPQG